ncbi:uncharacterized protein LOC117584072 [Drosophila guanche]|uniref:Uncharacterized protein n=1 Tax=Drosophila guanche TaxID=7266 RepID=A0A3B0K817_DROGU|nr:uncharacterized protein LOC117584072 [Drosophila guanche]SPP81776.1 Hypothetical predicted protein [Drosophila guanche]
MSIHTIMSAGSMDSVASVQYLGVHKSVVPQQQDELDEDMEELYRRIMPIDPNYDPALCRDQFLQTLFDDLGICSSNEEVPEGSPMGSAFSAYSLDPQSARPPNWTLESFVRKLKQKEALDALMPQASGIQIGERLLPLAAKMGRYDELLESMQRSSLFFMFRRTCYQLQVLQKACVQQEEMDVKELPNNMFSWSLEDFFRRRELKDFVYLDVLVRDHTPYTLGWAKYRVDLQETERFYKYFYSEIFKGAGYRKLLALIWEQKQMLIIDKALEVDLENSKASLESTNLKARRYSNAWWEGYKGNLVEELQQHLMEATVTIPIECRYLCAYYATEVEMQEIKDNVRTRQLQKELDDVRRWIQQSNDTTQASLNTYYVLIEDYRNRLSALSDKYDRDMDHWENEILQTNFRLAKARDDLKEAIDNVSFMRRRINEVQALIQAEQQAEIDRVVNEQQERQKTANGTDTNAPRQKVKGKAKYRKVLSKQRKS